MLTDKYNRQFKTLRVSLLSHCNLSCTYCTMGEDDVKEHNHTAILPAVQLLSYIKQLHTALNLKTIRLTGGEPLLYHELMHIINGVKEMGIPEIKLTTNGFLLERLAKPMKEAGLQSINVSLDAVDEPTFFLMSKRNNVQRILNGIDTALNAGLQVKLNAVIMKGMNDTQVLPLLKYAFERNITIRFLEIMAMGHLHADPLKYLFTQKEILSIIATEYNFERMDRNTSSTSNYWQTSSENVFGIIANESEPFCSDCNRLRLDSEGNIYGCLSSNHPISLKEVTDSNSLISKLQEAMAQKQSLKFTGSDLSMLHIGG